MSGRRKLVVAGARGLVGRAVIEHFSELPDWEVVGLSRSAPDFESRASFVPLDLRDREVTMQALEPHRTSFTPPCTRSRA